VFRKHSGHALYEHIPPQSGAEIETAGHDNAANCQTHCRKRMDVRVLKRKRGGGGGDQQKDGGPKEFQEQQPLRR
jgi:hypothetical protein